MGSSLSCFKKPREGAVRAVPERRRVSASEIQRPTSSFTASTSLTLEPKHRQSIEVEHSSENVKPVLDVEIERAEKLLHDNEETRNVEITKLDDMNEAPREESDAGGSGSTQEMDMPIAGSTLDDIGATDNVNVLVDMHVRAEKRLSESRTNVSQEESEETRSRESSVEVEGASKQSFPRQAPSLESMPTSLKAVADERVGERVREDKKRLADTVRPRFTKGRKESRKKELQRSDTMLDVRSSLPVKTHVTNYERIDAAARVDAEEMVKSGKFKFVAASG